MKIDSSCRDGDDATPLHIAARCGQLSVAKVLVEDYLCDPGVRDKDGLTPLDFTWLRVNATPTSLPTCHPLRRQFPVSVIFIVGILSIVE